MASSVNVLSCALAATVLWTFVGLPLARRLFREPSLALALAPALGWAVFTAAALPIFLAVGFTRATVAIVSGTALLAGIAALVATKSREPPEKADAARVPWWAYGAAVLLAIAPAVAIMPKFVGDGVILALPIYDHAKAAMIDDIARLGLPPGNPFFGEGGGPSRLAYYYLWHFGAAVFAKLLRVSGWEADIALTWFTAFSSLAVMMGLAVRLGGRRIAAFWAVALSAAISIRPVLSRLLGPDTMDGLLSSYTGLQAWIVQATWVPQHLAAATSVVLAVLLMADLKRKDGVVRCPTLALVVAAGFESSTWIGGVTFAAAAAPVGLVLLRSAEPRHGRRFFLAAVIAAALAVVIASPFLRDQYAATAARDVGIPIALWPYEVLGPSIPDAIRRGLDLPAYWLILLVVELPAIYLAGSITLARAATDRAASFAERRLAAALAALAIVSLAVSWLFISTILNNDLGWRAVLPGILVLTVFAAIGVSRWLAAPAPAAAAAAIALAALGLPDSIQFVRDNATGTEAASAAAFARSPELWEAVRRQAAPDERVGNNPLYLGDMTVRPVNISWALLADRRSCFVGWDLARPYVALPGARIDQLEALFERVFAGTGSPEEIRALAEDYGCRVVVVTPSDGAWAHDGFAASDTYRLVEEKADGWRLYRATVAARRKVAAIRYPARIEPRNDPATLDLPPLRQR